MTFSALAAITFQGEAWRWPAAGALVLAAGLVLWSYRRLPVRRRWLCATLKLAGIALLALCLLEPQWSWPRAAKGENLMVILADNSRSLQVADPGAARTRADELRALLDPSQGTWQTALADTFSVRRYAFDQRLQAMEDFSGLTFGGRDSALGAALQSLSARFQGRPLAGVLLLTDGNATDLPVLPPDLTGLPPVYPVIIGGTGPARDLSVRTLSVTQTAFEDAPVTVDAEIAGSGYAGTTVSVLLTDAAGGVVEEQSREMPSGSNSGPGPGAGSSSVPVRFQICNAPPGISFYQVSVRDRRESGPPATAGAQAFSPAAAGAGKLPESRTAEATPANNSRIAVVDRGQGPWRILYVSGRPNWEFKFLNRALEADAEVRLSALIRVARREPEFAFLGRAGETSNPIFRGTDGQDDTAVAGYDKPVLVRLNLQDEQELQSGFPARAEELFGYHAIIVDDLESAFFTPAQALLLQRFVSERGGGFLMLGGMESFGEGGYGRTPIGDMLPVRLDRTGLPSLTEAGTGGEAGESESAGRTGPFRFDLDREGWLQPWARLRANEQDEQARLADMPPLRVMNRVRGLKPGAGLVATGTGPDGARVPALAVQRFGLGRTAALTAGDLWRWGMRSPEARTDLEKSWRQLVRWLVADVPGRVSLTAAPPAADTGGAIPLEVRVRDAAHRPVEDATVTVTVEPAVLTTSNSAAASAGSFPAIPASVPATPPAGGTAGDTPAHSPAPAPGTGGLVLQAEPSPDEPGLYTAWHVPPGTGAWKATAVAVNSTGAVEGRATAGWAADLEARELRSLTPDTALMEELARRTGGAVTSPSSLGELAARLPSVRAPVMEPHVEPAWHSAWVFLAAIGCLAAEWGLRRSQGLP